MGTRQTCLAGLVSALLALAAWPGLANADEPRSIGYVLSFRLGVQPEQAQSLIEQLTTATSDWHGLVSHHGDQVARNCASSKECIRLASEALGVSRIGVVAMVAAAGVLRLDVRLMDASTGNEIQRTHTEFEIAAGEAAAEQAIFDLIPRLLPGEKAAPREAKLAGEAKPDKPQVPAISNIPDESASNGLELKLPATSAPSGSGTRWWLWGGLGAAAATITIVALVVTSGDDAMGVPVLELPPPR